MSHVQYHATMSHPPTPPPCPTMSHLHPVPVSSHTPPPTCPPPPPPPHTTTRAEGCWKASKEGKGTEGEGRHAGVGWGWGGVRGWWWGRGQGRAAGKGVEGRQWQEVVGKAGGGVGSRPKSHQQCPTKMSGGSGGGSCGGRKKAWQGKKGRRWGWGRARLQNQCDINSSTSHNVPLASYALSVGRLCPACTSAKTPAAVVGSETMLRWHHARHPPRARLTQVRLCTWRRQRGRAEWQQ